MYIYYVYIGVCRVVVLLVERDVCVCVLLCVCNYIYTLFAFIYPMVYSCLNHNVYDVCLVCIFMIYV